MSDRRLAEASGGLGDKHFRQRDHEFMDTITATSNLAALGSSDGVVRERARNALVADGGHDIVPALINELSDTRRQVRWEAVKALSKIANPIAALPLVRAMDDRDTDVAWIAAEGVANLGDSGFFALLDRLTHNTSTTQFCRLAHHSLRLLRKSTKYRIELDHIMKAMEGPEPTLAAPVAAYEVTQEIREAVKDAPVA